MNGKPTSNADETFISDNVVDGYSQTKLAAEKLVLQANARGFKTIAIRAPLIWGKGDQHVLLSIIQAIQNGKMQFIGGGLHQMVTCHVKSVCAALMLGQAAERGGEAYFITDGGPVVFKDFITKYVATQGVAVPDKNCKQGPAPQTNIINEEMEKQIKQIKQLHLQQQMPGFRASGITNSEFDVEPFLIFG